MRADYKTHELSKELQIYCKKHRTTPQTFSKIVTKSSRRKAHLILKLENLQAELILWILNHYQVPIEIIISGCIEYRKVVISTQRSLEIIIDQLCDGERYFDPVREIELP